MESRSFLDNKPLDRALAHFIKTTTKRLTELELECEREEIRARLLLATVEARATFKEEPDGQSAKASLYTYCNSAMYKTCCQIIREAMRERAVFDYDFELDPERIVDPGAGFALQEALYTSDIMSACNESERVVACELLGPSANVAERATSSEPRGPRGRGRPASFRDHMAGCIGEAHGMRPATVSYHMRNIKRKIGEIIGEN